MLCAQPRACSFASLPQRPRTFDEDGAFRRALSVMGDVYASGLGTTVMRHGLVPCRPMALDGEVLVLTVAGGVLDPDLASDSAIAATLCQALGVHGQLLSLERDCERWRARYA